MITRALATCISWMLWPLVVVVLGWRWAWDRVCDVDVIVDADSVRAIVRLSSGREFAVTRGQHQWYVGCYDYVPDYIGDACEVALVRSKQTTEVDHV